jgi:TolB-like protein
MVVQNLPLLEARAAGDGDRLAIAVVDFTNTSGDEEYDYLSKTIPETVITSLAESGELNIVERGRLQEALAEMQLQLTDIVDEASAVRLGRAVGANAIVVGSFVVIGRKIRISSRLIDVETATVITGKKATGWIGEDIFNVMDDMASAMKRELLQRRGEGGTMEVQRVELPKTTAEKKEGGSKTFLYVLGGAALVGAGVAAAMALSGGDDNGGADMVDVGIAVNW